MNEIDPKIATINKISSIEPDIKQKRSSQKGEDSFEKILTDQIEKTDNTATLKKAASLPEIESAYRAQGLNLEFNKTQFIQKLDISLNLLETYASWLGDPDKTLKQAYNLLEKILAQTKTLDQEFKENTTSNTNVKQLLTHLMTTVQIEQIKFNRGDYQSSFLP